MQFKSRLRFRAFVRSDLTASVCILHIFPHQPPIVFQPQHHLSPRQRHRERKIHRRRRTADPNEEIHRRRRRIVKSVHLNFQIGQVNVVDFEARRDLGGLLPHVGRRRRDVFEERPADRFAPSPPRLR